MPNSRVQLKSRRISSWHRVVTSCGRMTGTQHEHKGELRALRVLQEEVRRLQAENSRLEQARHDAQVPTRSDSIGRGLASPCAVPPRSFTRAAGWRSSRPVVSKGHAGDRRRPAPGHPRHLKTLLTNPRGLVPALRLARIRASQHQVRYLAWQQRHQLTAEEMDAIRTACQTLAARPVISLLMPVYNISAEWLQASVESVRQQLYPFWELCVVDDASTAPHIGPMLEEFAAADSRIKLKTLSVNENISGASNHALAMATGEFVAPLDHDDVLAPNALYEVVKRLNDDPTIDFIYTDHDMISSDGERHGPFFKPDWSPDLLLSMNYVTHFAVHRRALVVAAGGFRKGFEGSQDYDLVLRTTEQARRVAHIPLPLYSWGQPPTSVASDPKAKPYAHEAGRRALQEALARRGVEGEVLDGYGAPYRYRVKRAIIGSPLVSIIIPTRNNWRILKQCVDSLESLTHYRHFEILIVDNRSEDADTVAYLKSVPHRVVLFDEPFNFSRMNNVAAGSATGRAPAVPQRRHRGHRAGLARRDARTLAARRGRRGRGPVAVPQRNPAARRGRGRPVRQGRPRVLGLSGRPSWLLRPGPSHPQLQRGHRSVPDGSTEASSRRFRGSTKRLISRTTTSISVSASGSTAISSSIHRMRCSITISRRPAAPTMPSRT